LDDIDHFEAPEIYTQLLTRRRTAGVSGSIAPIEVHFKRVKIDGNEAVYHEIER